MDLLLAIVGAIVLTTAFAFFAAIVLVWLIETAVIVSLSDKIKRDEKHSRLLKAANQQSVNPCEDNVRELLEACVNYSYRGVVRRTMDGSRITGFYRRLTDSIS